MKTILNNRYHLQTEIGQGGMGTIYQAQDTILDRDVAIKILSRAGFGTEGRARFLREAKMIAKLNHPNIVTVHDICEADLDGLVPFIVMEYIEGVNLYEQPPETIEDVVEITRQICTALEHAHTNGIIHRDLKPENVIITPDRTAKLMDFGIARSVASRLTTEGAILGTVFYLAPEQAMGQEIDYRCDLYALGVLLYEMTAGELPFLADDPVAVIAQHIHAPVVPPRTINEKTPLALEALILQLMSKNPDDRPSSAGEVLDFLDAPEIMGAGIPSAEEHSVLDRILIGGESGTPARKPRHNINLPLSNLIGREEELARIDQQLEEPNCRLLTLIGVGGIGKTRLGLHASAAAVDKYPDGIWLVELAALNEDEILPDKIASIFGVSAQEARSGIGVTDVLIDYLNDKTLLLVLDNCEHLIEACARFADSLLNGCPSVKIMATSREAFGIYDERIFQVSPLILPPQESAMEGLEIYPAIQLFLERASKAQPGFRLTNDNSPILAEICWQLDGIPLAIELAAARVRVISLDQISKRLKDRFRLLTGGPRTALPRHQTLQATMDWSYELLPELERSLLRRLSVFSGGWTLKAAEDVVNFGEVTQQDVLDLLSNLVDKSLVLVEDRGVRTRYGMLETVRQYGFQMLTEDGEVDESRQRHGNFFVQLAEQVDDGLRDARQVESMDILDTEHDNLRGALRWATENNEKDLAFHLVGALGWYWFMRGHWKESWRWFHNANELEASSNPTIRAKAICRAVGLEIIRGNLVGTVELVDEAVEICRQTEDEEGLAWSLNLMGQSKTWSEKDFNQAKAMPYLIESEEIFSGLGNDWGVAFTQPYIGQVVEFQGEYEQSIRIQKKGISIFERVGDKWSQAYSLYLLGNSATRCGDYQLAEWAYEQSLNKSSLIKEKVMEAHALKGLGELALQKGNLKQMEMINLEALEALQKIGDENCVGSVLRCLGEVAQRKGDYVKADKLLGQSLLTYGKLGLADKIIFVIDRIAALAAIKGKSLRAAKLLGASNDLDGETGILFPSQYKDERKNLTKSIREIIGDREFQAFYEEGAAMSLEDAVTYAMEISDS